VLVPGDSCIAGRPEVHLHFHGVTAEDVTAIFSRVSREDRQQARAVGGHRTGRHRDIAGKQPGRALRRRGPPGPGARCGSLAGAARVQDGPGWRRQLWTVTVAMALSSLSWATLVAVTVAGLGFASGPVLVGLTVMVTVPGAVLVTVPRL